MEETTLSPNMQKYHNYQNQFSRLNKAMKAEFYLEAIFISYAIIEDRTKSILEHGGHWDAYIKSRRGHQVTLDSKIKHIRKVAEAKKSLEHRYLSDETLGNILVWKDQRNVMVHALLNQSVSTEELAELAETGKQLACDLRTMSGNFNRASDRLKKKENP